MMESPIFQFILTNIDSWGYYALFLMTFLETSAFIGFLVPGESVVVVAGLLASQASLNLGTVVVVASVGAILGDTVGYFVGKRFGEPFFLKYGRVFRIRKEYLDEVRGYFDRHGGTTVFFGRFMALLRAFAPAVAGMSRMHYPSFLIFNVAGGIIWASVYSIAGYFIGDSWEAIHHALGRIGLIAFTGGILVVFGYFFVTKKRRFLNEKTGWIDRKLSEQFPLMWGFAKARFDAARWYGFSLTVALVLLTASTVALAEIIHSIVTGRMLARLDVTVQSIVEWFFTPGLTRFMVHVTNIAGVYLTITVVTIVAIELVRKRDWWELFGLAVAVGVGEIFLGVLKLAVHRPRPLNHLVAVHGSSFPSGHAFAAMLIYGYSIYLAADLIRTRRARAVVYALSVAAIVLVGVSRVYLQAHWLTDVLGAYVAAFAWLLFALITVRTFRKMSEGDGEPVERG